MQKKNNYAIQGEIRQLRLYNSNIIHCVQPNYSPLQDACHII